MNIILYPYTKAYEHYKQAQHAEWGPWKVVHYTAAALEYIPFINYPVVVIDLVVRKVFAAFTLPASFTAPLLRPSQWNAVQFLKDHKIAIESPLIKSISLIKNDWNKTVDMLTWTRRIPAIKNDINFIKNGINSDQQQELKNVIIILEAVMDAIRNPRTDAPEKNVQAEYQKFNDLFKKEQGLQEARIQNLQAKFNEIEHPVIGTVENYISTLGFKNKDEFKAQMNFSYEVLAQRGITAMADIDYLGLCIYDQDIVTLQQFECCQGIDIKHAYSEFIELIRHKLYQEKGFVASIEHLPLKLQSLIESPHETFATNFKAYVVLRQKELLKAYINQNNGNFQWVKLNESGITDVIRLREVHEGINLYDLDRNLVWA